MNIKKQIQDKKNAKNIIHRLDDIEKVLPGIVEGLKAVVEKLAGRISRLEEILQAVLDDVGEERIEAAIMRRRTAEAENVIQIAVAEGQLEKTETIAPLSLVVGRYEDLQGVVTVPRIQVGMLSLESQVQEALAGKTMPFTYEGKDNQGRDYRLVVTEAYNPVVKSTETPAAAQLDASVTAELGESPTTQAQQ